MKPINRTTIVAAIVLSLSAVAAYALPQYTGFTARSTGYVVTAADWNGEFQNFINHVNTHCIGTLNQLLGKGRILSSDGTSISALTNNGAADNGKILTLDDSQLLGIKWDTPPGAIVANRDCSGRLTAFSNTPYPGASTISSASTIYYTPAGGNTIDLYESSQWKKHTFSQISIPVGSLSVDKNYDVFIYDNDNNDIAEAADVVQWTDNSNRATALVRQDGVYVKSGATNRRYVGTFRTNFGTATVPETSARRFIWNYYNRVDLFMAAGLTSDSWTYASTAWRQINNLSGIKCELVVGVSEELVHIDHYAQASGGDAAVGIGIDQTTAQNAEIWDERKNSSSGELEVIGAHKYTPLAAGYHQLYPLEKAISGTATFYGVDSGNIQTGMKVVTRM